MQIVVEKLIIYRKVNIYGHSIRGDELDWIKDDKYEE